MPKLRIGTRQPGRQQMIENCRAMLTIGARQGLGGKLILSIRWILNTGTLRLIILIVRSIQMLCLQGNGDNMDRKEMGLNKTKEFHPNS
jgi:hypothetical protein